MYKGKFDQKKKSGTTDIHELVAQRNQPAAPDIPELKPRKPQQPRPAAQRPVQNGPRPAAPNGQPIKKTMPQKAAAPQKPPQAAPKRKGPRLGGVIFYTLYFLFILIFFLATLVGLLWLRGWLGDFQAAQPTVKVEQVFTQLFTDPDWDALYDAAGAKDSAFDGKEAYVAYMENKVGSSQLNYLETSAGLSGNKKYVVRLGEEKVASFTLVDKNNVGSTTLDNITELPDWQLGSVEVFFERSESYRIEKMADHTAYVNDVALNDDYTIQKATTKAEEYLPEGVTSASTIVQEVTGLMSLPTVTVMDKRGNPVEVTYDESTRTFTARTESNTMSEDEKNLALKTAETYCLFMIEKAGRADIAKYFEATSRPYKDITTLGELWMQGSAGHEFVNQEVKNYARYSDSIFSVQVSMTLNVTRKDGTVKGYDYNQSLFFRKGDNGSWKAYEMTNKDVSAPEGRVRLTFMDGENQLVSEFFETGAKSIVTPLLPVPEGKVFSGWARKDVDSEGNVTYTLMFQPDEHGTVTLAEGTNLLPMTLHAVFEDADAVTEPAPEATEEVSE